MFERDGSGIYARVDGVTLQVAVSSARDSAFIAAAPHDLLRLVEEIERDRLEAAEAKLANVLRQGSERLTFQCRRADAAEARVIELEERLSAIAADFTDYRLRRGV